MKRRSFCVNAIGAVGALALAPSCVAAAKAWPTRPVRIIVPSMGGSPWDPLARLLAERLGAAFGQPFIVENKSGATGTIGMDAVAKDTSGDTLGVIFMPHVLTPSLFRKMPYDILRDVQPVCQTQWSYNVLVVRAALPIHSMAELVAYARDNPGKLSMASGGNGSPAHVMGEYFKQASGTSMLHVPYRGPVAALKDLIGGQADVMFAATAPAIPFVQSGQLRAIGVTSTQRLDALPGVPTFAEAGYAQFDVRDWAGIVASPAVPATAVGRLNAAINKVLAEPDVQAQYAKMGIYLHGGSAQELGALMQSELVKWRGVIKSAGLQLD